MTTLQSFECGKSADFPFEAVHLCVDRQSQKNPQKIALKFRGRAFTYAELHRYSSALCERLRAEGVKPGDRVGIWMSRSAEALTAILAILRAGATYVPIDFTFPQRRVETILEDCSPVMVLCLPGTQCRGAQRVFAVDLQELGEAVASDGAAAPIEPNDPIYVIYTSGTTGKPKGIVQTHAAIANLIAWQNRFSGIDFGGAVLQYSSLSFDVHLQELFSTWSSGGCLCVIDEESRLDADLLLSLIRDEKIETLFLSISALQNLFVNRQGVRTLPECVRHVITAGEQLYLTNETMELLRERPSLAIHNHYGVSESHVVTTATLRGADAALPHKVPVGVPIANTRVIILDENRRRVPVGEKGEIWIGGVCLAAGYLNRPDLDAQYYHELEGMRYYRTRDIGAWLPSGDIEFFGRIDTQVKISGSLVEPAEVEAHLLEIPGIQKCAVVAPMAPEGRYLVAFFVADRTIEVGQVRETLARVLPSFMIPLKFEQASSLPVGATGKIDRTALVAREESGAPAATPPRVQGFTLQTSIAQSLSAALHVSLEGHSQTNFFELGAGSLQIVTAAATLSKALGIEVSPLAFYRHPTIGELAEFLSSGRPEKFTCRDKSEEAATAGEEPIAIVGMAGQFPGADSVAGLWSLLLEGRDGTSEVPLGTNSGAWLMPRESSIGSEVARAGLLDDPYSFDAEFFGISKGDALWMDPQHRLFLQCAYHALEDAHVVRDRTRCNVGVFAGCDVPSYLAHVQPQIDSMTSYLRALSLNDKDFLSTRASYELDLRGPSITIQTACSTSLVAVHMAAQSLLCGDCDVALAGAVSLGLPQDSTYFFEEGGIYSPDGKMRPFDQSGSGIIITNAVGVVCLKRLSAAVRDGNRIYALIRGSAVNNDGGRKVGYSAPSAQGQREVVAQALSRAKVSPDSVAFIEAHGTGTQIGDPIEVEGLLESYSSDPQGHRRCALGSIKGNIGHANRAAGVVGLIKAALSLYHGVFPGTANIQQLNSLLRLEGTSFFVNREPIRLTSPAASQPLCGAVSSFGLGGTNAHVVLEAPRQTEVIQALQQGPYLLPLSAKSEDRLSAVCAKLADHVGTCRSVRDLLDLSYTACCAKENFEFRSFIVGLDRESLIQECSRGPVNVLERRGPPSQTAFLFPGHTIIDERAFCEALREVPLFNQELSKLIAQASALGFDLSFIRAGYFESLSGAVEPDLVKWHLAIVTVELALARVWEALGVTPRVLVGYSLGEIAAAHVAGGMDLGTLLQLVSARARCLASSAPGRMLVAFIDAETARQFLSTGCEIAIEASRSTTIFAGDEASIDALKQRLELRQIGWRMTSNTRANHSRHMKPFLSEFKALLETLKFTPLVRPVCAGAQGAVRLPGETLDAEHWTRHVVEPVFFTRYMRTAHEYGATAWIELDLTPTLLRFVQQDLDSSGAIMVPPFGVAETAHVLLSTIGRFWAAGGSVDLSELFRGSGARFASIPHYPFERKQYFIPYSKNGDATEGRGGTAHRHPALFELQEIRIRPDAEAARRLNQPGSELFVCLAPGLEALSDKVQRALRELETPAGVIRAERGSHYSDFPAELLAVVRKGGSREFVLVETTDSMLQDIDGGPVGSSFHRYKEKILRLVQAAPASTQLHLRFVFVSNGADTTRAALCEAMLRALAITIPQEHSAWQASFLRLAGSDASVALAIANCREQCGPETHLLVENGVRLLEQPSKLALPEVEQEISEGELILVGGTGKFGFDLAFNLLVRHGLSLTVVGRRSSADISGQLQRFRTWDTRFRYVQADTTSAAELAEVLRERKRSGANILAVLHLAAHISDQDFLQSLKDLSVTDLSAHEEAKLSVLFAIEKACTQEKVAKKVLFSSLSSFLGGVGYFGYTWSNAAADLCSRIFPGWISINWDVVRTGTAHGQDLAVTLGSGAELLQLEVADCAKALMTILSLKGRQYILSKRSLSGFAAARSDIRASLNARTDQGKVETPSCSEVSKTQVEAIRDIWKEMLGSSEVPGESSFASLGGNSLLAVQTILTINHRLGLRVPLSAMMKSRSFNEFAATVREHSPRDPMLSECPPSESVRVTPWEDRWYVMAQRGFGRLQMPIVVNRRLDAGLVEKTLRVLCACHEGLRTLFKPASGGLERRVLSDYEMPYRVTELKDANLDSQRRVVHEAWQRLNAVTFELDVAPPFYSELLLLDRDTSVLLVVTHHIVFDGWSSSIFAEDFEKVYTSLERGQEPAVTGTPYSRFADWYEQYRQGQEYELSRSYWLSACDELLPPTRLPAGGEFGPDEHRMPAHRLHFTVSANLTKELGELASRHDMSLFEIYFAAFLITLHSLTEEERLVVGSTDSGRHGADVERTVGVFVNPMPLTFKVNPADLVQDFLAQVRNTVEEFKLHQLYPLWTLWKEHPDAARLDSNNLFHFYILYQNYYKARLSDANFLTVLEVDDLQTHPLFTFVHSEQHTLMRDVELILFEHEEEVSCNFWYRAHVLTEMEAQLCVDCMQKALVALVAAGDRVRVSDIAKLFRMNLSVKDQTLRVL